MCTSMCRYGFGMVAVLFTMSQFASARNRSPFNSAIVLCLASLARATADDTVLHRAMDMSRIPNALRRYLVVVALTTSVRITIPAV